MLFLGGEKVFYCLGCFWNSLPNLRQTVSSLSTRPTNALTGTTSQITDTSYSLAIIF
jgi:hypothetical protein